MNKTKLVMKLKKSIVPVIAMALLALGASEFTADANSDIQPPMSESEMMGIPEGGEGSIEDILEVAEPRYKKIKVLSGAEKAAKLKQDAQDIVEKYMRHNYVTHGHFEFYKGDLRTVAEYLGNQGLWIRTHSVYYTTKTKYGKETRHTAKMGPGFRAVEQKHLEYKYQYTYPITSIVGDVKELVLEK